jgi:hypothetical protein
MLAYAFVTENLTGHGFVQWQAILIGCIVAGPMLTGGIVLMVTALRNK